jgi:enamine deaminase RidA (YjgF/YER057c/UK114 family)
MVKKQIKTNDAPAAIGPYSQAIQVGDLTFYSGLWILKMARLSKVASSSRLTK